jgi:hypothetical protein
MLTRRAALCLPGVLALGRPAWGISKPDVVGDVAKAALTPVPDIEADIEQQMENWIDDSGFGARDGKDLTVVSNTWAVQELASNPNWVRARVLAYEIALLKAQAEFVARQHAAMVTNTVARFAKGVESPPPYQDVRTSGQAADILRKTLAVANGKLDDQLRSMGVDPGQYEHAPEPQKAAMLSNQLKKNIVKSAFGLLAGMVTVKTFEGQNGAKQHHIGVVAVASPEMTDFARQVLTARGQFTPNPVRAQDLRKTIRDNNQLVHDFGVRRCFDEQGLPVIVSFGQWGSAYEGGDPALAAAYRDVARTQAEQLADSQIAEFLKGVISYQNTSDIGTTLGQAAVSLPEGGGVEPPEKKIEDFLNERISRTAAVDLVGQRTLYRWTARHPASNTPILGVVRMWSAASEQGMRALAAGGAKQNSADPSEKHETPGVIQSRSLMDVSDF